MLERLCVTSFSCFLERYVTTQQFTAASSTIVLVLVRRGRIRTTLVMLCQLILVKLLHALNLFKSHSFLAERAVRIIREPLLDAASVIIVPNVARQRRHLRIFIEVLQANHARILTFEHICVIVPLKKPSQHFFCRFNPPHLRTLALVPLPHNYRRHKECKKCHADCHKCRKRAKDHYNPIVELHETDACLFETFLASR